MTRNQFRNHKTWHRYTNKLKNAKKYFLKRQPDLASRFSRVIRITPLRHIGCSRLIKENKSENVGWGKSSSTTASRCEGMGGSGPCPWHMDTTTSVGPYTVRYDCGSGASHSNGWSGLPSHTSGTGQHRRVTEVQHTLIRTFFEAPENRNGETFGNFHNEEAGDEELFTNIPEFYIGTQTE